MKSFSELTDIVKDNEASLLRYASRLLSDNEGARDIVQDAFMRFIKYSHKVTESAKILNPSAWLYRTTRNLCYDHFRSKRRQVEMTLDEDRDIADFADHRQTPDAKAVAQDQVKAVRQAINQLPTRDREVVVLKLEHEKSYKEIAEIMNLTVGNVGFIIHNSMKKIQKSIKLN